MIEGGDGVLVTLLITAAFAANAGLDPDAFELAIITPD